jgi:hypothetical protein
VTSNAVACEGCGFIWDDVDPTDAPSRLAAAVAAFTELIRVASASGLARPSPERWSIVEYAGHLRDALLSMRERIIVASVIDLPTGTPIYRDERIDLGFARLDTPDEVVAELEMATGLMLKTILTLPEDSLERLLVYSPNVTSPITIAWVIAQAVHEAEHHLSDVTENWNAQRH